MEYAFAQGPVPTRKNIRAKKIKKHHTEPGLINVAKKLTMVYRTLKVFLRMKQNDISRRRNSGDLHA